VPVRYDVGIQSTINKQIESYNKKLHKIIKGFMHVQLIKVTTNREEFTKHGLHLNWKGKEKMTNELLKCLTITEKKQESVTIYLPWKSETREIDVRNAKTERVNVAPYVSIVTNDSKDMVSQKGQQEDNHVTGKNSVIITKEISRNSKLQRNCPKVKNDDFLWN